MAKLRSKKNYISIPFVDENDKEKFVLRFSITDESLNNLYKQADEVDKITKEIEESSKEATREQTKGVLKQAIDAIFDEGAFDKLYGESGSVIVTVEYYAELIALLVDELQKTKMKELENKLPRDYS